MGAAAGSGTAGTAGTALGQPLGQPGPVAGRPAGLCFKAPRLPTQPTAESTLNNNVRIWPRCYFSIGLCDRRSCFGHIIKY